MNPSHDNDVMVTGEGEVEAEPMEMDDDGHTSGRSRSRHHHRPSSRYLNYTPRDDIRESSETRERRHAALSILNDPELLMFHALASNESIPQARRRFTHHLIGIPPPTTRPFAIRDLSRYPRQDDSQYIYLRRQPPPSASASTGGHDTTTTASGGNKPSSYTAFEQAPTMIDIIEINGVWQWDRGESEGGAAKAKNVSTTTTAAAAAAGAGGASPGSSGRGKGKGRG
ncbi:hypothetical protein PRK78_002524 [Emydomyces testavorans]|uniref:Uncharacterized protein n=1 Tax=Emydomyces testavorans TaxID=2070801 RepID=A0AAF0DF90_9EURO|nr:hypothetical protein PRK78_002524 [Emydomyces testavorans]